jgi:hypothetical protein
MGTTKNKTLAAGLSTVTDPAPDKLQNLNIDSIILVLPAGDLTPAEIIHLRDIADIHGIPDVDNQTSTEKKLAAWQAWLSKRLQDHHFRSTDEHPDADSYVNLYADDGTIDKVKVRNLLRDRCKPGKFPQPLEDTMPFSARDDFQPMIKASLMRLSDEIERREAGDPRDATVKDRPFRLRPDPEDKEGCLPVPPQMQGFTAAVNQFIRVSRQVGGKQGEVPVPQAKKWLNGSYDGITLFDRMNIVADRASSDHIIYHEPHHELTPGLLLIDEIFRALVEEVTVKVQAINPVDLDDPATDLKDLVAFVTGLEEAIGESGKFGTYILHSGETGCQLRPGESIHVDPSRIELFLEGDQIRVTSAIVGAWAGGTHSAGHTT